MAYILSFSDIQTSTSHSKLLLHSSTRSYRSLIHIRLQPFIQLFFAFQRTLDRLPYLNISTTILTYPSLSTFSLYLHSFVRISHTALIRACYEEVLEWIYGGGEREWLYLLFIYQISGTFITCSHNLCRHRARRHNTKIISPNIPPSA